MKPALFCAVLLNAALLFTQCQFLATAEDPDTIVARVNQSTLTVDQLEAELDDAALPAATLQMRRDWVSVWIRTELLYQEALRRDFDGDGKTLRELDRMRRDHLANVVLEHVITDSSMVVTDEEVAGYFEANRKEFVYHEPELRLSVIVLPDEATARQVRGLLSRRSSTFEELARTRSIHASSADGGDLGFLKRADITDISVQEIVFSLSVGQVSRPVLSESGSFIFRVAERRAAGTVPPLDEVRGEIVNRMLQDRRRELVRRFVDALRQSSDVEIFNGNLMRSEPDAQ
ncbi:MAG: peptidylprolyl isomerase [Gemmatimonadetes bacterium]|nr:peptidylprolyl isomerase [Gemmatimonadota bacterium]